MRELSVQQGLVVVLVAYATTFSSNGADAGRRVKPGGLHERFVRMAERVGVPALGF